MDRKATGGTTTIRGRGEGRQTSVEPGLAVRIAAE